MGVPFVLEDVGSMPCPGFEGFEKRLEVQFSPAPASVDPEGAGLRAVSRADLDAMLKEAECTVVSQLSLGQVDSYVLSESSLFVQPCMIVIKTCGTTQLLRVLPRLLGYAARLQLEVLCCKYTRGSFIFPAVQPFQGDFNEEVKYLERYFGHLGAESYVLGADSVAHKWHVYYAAAKEIVHHPKEVYTLEMCMTELDRGRASLFEKKTHETALEMTQMSGIGNLLPGSQICDFAFDPCGYSMNSVSGGAHSTIHVTPEAGFSYASFEAMGYGPHVLQALVDKVALVFMPDVFSVAMFAGGGGQDVTRSSLTGSIHPRGYSCSGTSVQVFWDKSMVVYHTFERTTVRTAKLVDSGDFGNSYSKASKGLKAEGESTERLVLAPCASAQLMQWPTSESCCRPINSLVSPL